MTDIPSCMLSQYLWYNVSIQVDQTSIHFLRFSGNPTNRLYGNGNGNLSLKNNQIVANLITHHRHLIKG